MADCLIALGLNLGDRAEGLRQAFAALAKLPDSQLVARSRHYQSAAVGGPTGQGEFFNAAALLSTALHPRRLLTELQRIEAVAGRTPGERWGARPLDLDLAIYEGVCTNTPELTLPHPRMSYRRFVLEPAAEIAAYLVHGESGWTVERLLRHLNELNDVVVVAGESTKETEALIDQLEQRLGQAGSSPHHVPHIMAWTATADVAAPRPKLILATSGAPGGDLHQRRKILKLPASCPIAWIGLDAKLDSLDEAAAAIKATWPPTSAAS